MHVPFNVTTKYWWVLWSVPNYAIHLQLNCKTGEQMWTEYWLVSLCFFFHFFSPFFWHLDNINGWKVFWKHKTFPSSFQVAFFSSRKHFLTIRFGCSHLSCSFKCWFYKNYFQPKWFISLLSSLKEILRNKFVYAWNGSEYCTAYPIHTYTYTYTFPTKHEPYFSRRLLESVYVSFCACMEF